MLENPRTQSCHPLAPVAFALALALSAPAARAADPAPTIDWAAWARETKELLAAAIRTDTTNPPGDELALCKRLKEILDKDGIPNQILESQPGRGNLIATLKATDPRPGRGAMIWLAHLDVVGTKGQDWTVPPFDAVEKDGYLYGRGAIDDKGMAIVGLQVIRLVHQQKLPLTRDFVLMLTADEESSAKAGVQWLLKNHPELMRADFVLNENGDVVMEGGRVQTIEIQTGEKTYIDLKVTATGAGGHSSLPVGTKTNAIYTLSKALARLSEHQVPVEIQETIRAAFTILGKTSMPDAPLFKEALSSDPKVAGPAIEKLCEKPYYNAVLRTTFVATMIEGGTRVNVLPAKATANVNCRVLPGTDIPQLLSRIKEFLGDPSLQMEYPAEDVQASPSSPIDNPLFAAIVRAGSKVYPEAVALPRISPGASDSRFFRLAGIPCYGLMPFPVARDDVTRLHAADERIPIASLEPGLKMGYQIVVEVNSNP